MVSIFGSLIDQILPQEETKGALYIGNYLAAINQDLLQEKEIKAVLTVANTNMVNYKNFDYVKYHEIIFANDIPEYNILEQLQKGIEFIQKSRKETNILVHCFQGISRSASMVIAYLMKEFNLTYEKAYLFTHSKRAAVNPNPGFVLQLKSFQKMLKIEDESPSSQNQ